MHWRVTQAVVLPGSHPVCHPQASPDDMIDTWPGAVTKIAGLYGRQCTANVDPVTNDSTSTNAYQGLLSLALLFCCFSYSVILSLCVSLLSLKWETQSGVGLRPGTQRKGHINSVTMIFSTMPRRKTVRSTFLRGFCMSSSSVCVCVGSLWVLQLCPTG